MIVCSDTCSLATGIVLSKALREEYNPDLQEMWKILDDWVRTAAKGPLTSKILAAYRTLLNAAIPGHKDATGATLCPLIGMGMAELFGGGVAVPEDVIIQEDWRVFLAWWRKIVLEQEYVYISDMDRDMRARYERILDTPLPDTGNLVFGRDTRTMMAIQGQIISC